MVLSYRLFNFPHFHLNLLLIVVIIFYRYLCLQLESCFKAFECLDSV